MSSVNYFEVTDKKIEKHKEDDEIYFEAVSSFHDNKTSMEKRSYENPHDELFFKAGTFKPDSLSSTYFDSKKSNYSSSNQILFKNMNMSFNNKLLLQEKNLQLLTMNKLNKIKNASEIKRSNNIQSTPKINVNFNINISCEKEDIAKNQQDIINLCKIENITPYVSIYESVMSNLDTFEEINFIENINKIDNEFQKFRKNSKISFNKSEISGNESYSSSLQEELEKQSRKITNVKFYLKNEINLSFFLKNLKIINVKVSPQNRHFRILLELQNFQVDSQQLWVVKISDDCRYLATGGKIGMLKIFEIQNFNFENYKNSYKNEDIFSYLNFINEKPFRVYNDHSNDIIDICWSPRDQDEDEKFVSGCLDKIIRIWSLKKNKVLDYINIKEYITAISYLPSGDMIVVGTHNGRCSIYDCSPKLRYNFSFTCRNRMGKFSNGRKITSIEFVSRTQALITTNDSRVRLVNISDGKLVQKYKGHVNEEYMIKSFPQEMYDLVISASEDGHVVVWNKFNKENSNKKNYSCEFFRPFNKDTSTCSLLVNDKCLTLYLKKLIYLTTKIMVFSICINTSAGGRLQVLLNCDCVDTG